MLVLVTTDRRPGGPSPAGSPRVRPKRPEYWVGDPYIQAVRQAGGTPILLPPGEPELESLLDRVDAVVLTGGDFDIPADRYGQLVTTALGHPDAVRADAELHLARLCVQRDLPVLGVCAGMQVLAVATGGSLIQDIPAELPEAENHEQPTDPAEGWHQVHLEGSMLRHVLGRAPVVNSTHHQAVADPGQLRVTGRAPDGVIEAIEMGNHRFCLGVQWHPELLGQWPIYKLLVQAAR
ncbi:MAG: gamma-glutamyl-gamma-aminobutyrate hydrolase family protein [Alphaproteobacteria bacterium]|nr:gamma-glutamyl-gamma-aminobutyrate hydrolase family protein [Alphaproteobacteria bacterium]MCB9793109.1 gamma-glutamyl-gamma-aminobutyrate hydrolase family protein [Alphaproteobacteria bacterium]